MTALIYPIHRDPLLFPHTRHLPTLLQLLLGQVRSVRRLGHTSWHQGAFEIQKVTYNIYF